LRIGTGRALSRHIIAEGAHPLPASLYDIPLTRLDGTPATLGDFTGQVLLIVNVASKCGLTPQYEGLEALYRDYRDRGLAVLGFPANDFKEQEPGTDEEIGAFCTSVYGVDFPMFSKITVTGPDTHPVYKALIEAHPNTEFRPGSYFGKLPPRTGPEAGGIHWNFEKFLVARDGSVVARFGPDTTPQDPAIVAAIEKALAA
jgi:glutathione peroxidase